jgi:hypothetical protein
LHHDSNAYALVFFTPYRPWLLKKDLAFFDSAKEAGFRVEKILEKLMDKVMFEEDPGVSYRSYIELIAGSDVRYRMKFLDEQYLASRCSGPRRTSDLIRVDESFTSLHVEHLFWM